MLLARLASRISVAACVAACVGSAARTPDIAPEHRDRYLRVSSGGPESALPMLRDAIRREVARTLDAGGGYPRLATVEWVDVPGDPGVKRFVCRPTESSGPEVTAILVDGEGRCVRMAYLPYPTARLVALEVFLLTTEPVSALETQERHRIPRVVVEDPILAPDAASERLRAAIERALASAGMREHRYRRPDG